MVANGRRAGDVMEYVDGRCRLRARLLPVAGRVPRKPDPLGAGPAQGCSRVAPTPPHVATDDARAQPSPESCHREYQSPENILVGGEGCARRQTTFGIAEGAQGRPRATNSRRQKLKRPARVQCRPEQLAGQGPLNNKLTFFRRPSIVLWKALTGRPRLVPQPNIPTVRKSSEGSCRYGRGNPAGPGAPLGAIAVRGLARAPASAGRMRARWQVESRARPNTLATKAGKKRGAWVEANPRWNGWPRRGVVAPDRSD